MTKDNYIYSYYQGIKNGKYTVGRWIELVYDYIIQGLQEKRFFFDQQKANQVIEWVEEHCYHTEGPLAPGPLRLEPWQKAFISCVYGLVDEEGRRQFREIILVIGRKNGKTKVASALGDYEFRVGGGFGSRVFCLAPKLDQADLVYNDIWQMVVLDESYQVQKLYLKETDERGRLVRDDSELPRHRQSDLAIPATNSSVKK